MKKLVLNFFIIGMILGICIMSFYNFNISREIDIKAAEIINSYDSNEINLTGEKLVVTDTQLNNICNILKNDKYKDYINNLTDDYLRNNFGKVRRNIKELSGYNAGTPDEEIENTEYDIVMTYLYYRVNAIKLLEELVDGKLVTTEYEELKNNDYIRKNASELLGYARDVKEKIEILGLIYRVSKICNYGDENDTTKVSYDEFAERAKLEMEYVCSEDKNWLSTSFLGTAELAYSMGLGYDWFQEYLPMETKEIIEKSIIKNALIPFCLDAQDDTFTNITEVSYSGIGVAALSILNTEYNINLEQSNQYYKVTSEEFIINDTENIIKNVNTIVDSEIINILNTEILENNTNSITSQELSTAILKKVLTKMPTVLQNVYDEGGIYREGPMYWGYGTSYISYFLTSVNNTLGSDYVKNILGQVNGIEKMLLYPIYVSNNIYTGDYNVFNYSDSQAKFTCAGYDDMGLANLYAEVTGNMQYTQALYYFKNRLSGNAYGYYNMIWYNPEYDKEVSLEEIVNDTILQNALYKSGIAMLRTNYIDNKYIFTGLRGGNNHENHAQLDKGSFIFESLGTRWIEEPEYSPYSSKHYFGGYPYGYQYYLKRAESHNTIVINPQNNDEVETNGYAEPDQYIYAETEFVKIESQDNASISILDLSSAYNKEKNGIENASENSNTVLRGIKLFDSKKYMVLQDEISLENEGEIYSFLNINNSEISNIEISDNGREVILTDNENQQLKLKLICDNEIAGFEKIDKKALNDYLNKENDNFTYTSNLQYQYKDDDGNEKYYQKLAIHLENVRETRITVVFIPIYSVNEELEYTEENVVDLAEWYIPTAPEIIAKTEYDESINNNETVYGSVKLDLKSSQGKEDEIILYSLDNGETWKNYTENITFDIAGEYSILTKAVDKTKSESNISRLSFEIQRKVVEKIEVTKLPNKLNYLPKDEKIDLTGGILTATYNDGKTEKVELISNEVEVSGYNSEKLGEQTITVTYGSCETTFKVMVARATPEYMVPTNITATEGQKLSDIELPEGFEWMDENKIVYGSGDIIYKAKYIPKDTTNYETVENIEISISVVTVNEDTIEGTYYISTAINEKYILDIEEASKSNGAKLQIWEKVNLTDNQKFEITSTGDGYYTIKVLHSGKVLDIPGAGMVNGTKVQQYTSNQTDAQKWKIVQNADGTYSMMSKCNGLYLDIPGAGARNGVKIQVYEGNGTQAQKFKLFKIEEIKGEQTIEDGLYKIKTSTNRIIGLDVDGLSRVNGANVQIWTESNIISRNQRFEVTYKENGYYEIKAQHSGKSLDVAGAGTTNGTNVQQYTSNGTDAQRWIIRDNLDGTYSIQSKVNGLYIDVYGGLIRNGSNIQMYEGNGSSAQKFVFEKVEKPKCEQILEDGIYKISTALNSNMCLDIAGGSYNNQANLQIWDGNIVQQKKFELKYNEEGYYEIINVNSGKVLDVAGGSNANGANVQQYESNNTEYQKWIIQDAGNGYYYIVSRGAEAYLDIAGGRTLNGANVQIYDGNASVAQKFKLEKYK